MQESYGFRLALIFLVCWLNSTSHSQEVAPDAPPVTREQTIYVPYSKLRDVFEKEGRGVFLPYEQFQQLWQAAREAERPLNARTPVDAIITEISSVARVQNDVVLVTAEVQLELLKQGWSRVPLRLRDAAIQAATIDDVPARIVPDQQGNYELIVENNSGDVLNITLQLTYLKAISKSPGRNQVTFAAPQAPINRWTIRIPQSGVDVTVNPMIAATSGSLGQSLSGATDNQTQSDGVEPSEPRGESEESSGDKAGTLAGGTDETVLLALVGSAPAVEIIWTPQSEGATGLTALANVQTQQEVYISEGSVRIRARLAYEVSRAQLTKLEMEVPADYKVVNVFDPNVRKWDVKTLEDAALQRVSIELFEPVSAVQNISLELERLFTADALQVIDSPMIEAVGVGRHQGMVVVKLEPTLRAEVKSRQGLQQLDPAELPKALAAASWDFAFRYSALPATLSLAVEKLQPRISVVQQVRAFLQIDQLVLDMEAQYKIEQAGVFQLEYDVPEDFEVVLVRGSNSDNATPVDVDSYYINADDPTRLTINLARKAMDKSGLLVRIQKRLNDPNLQQPTGQASTLNIPIPQPNQPFIEQFDGRLVLLAPESLRLSPAISSGLRATEMTDILLQSPSTVSQANGARPVLAFAYNQEARQLDLSVERRSPYVTVAQVMVVRVEPGVVKYRAMFFIDILYSGINSLRLDVPAEDASSIRVVEGKLRDAVIDPVPDDVAPDHIAWGLSGDTELIGKHNFTLAWEKEIPELPVGQSADIGVPRIVPMGVDRAWGQVVVSKAESLDVQPLEESQGLRPIDPNQDVMPDGRVNDAASAFEFYGDWDLKLTATRYELQEVKRTSIERGLVSAIITRSKQRNFQALYRVRSTLQRVAILLPPEAEFSTQPARINGNPVPLERGDQGVLFIPLVGTDPNAEFLLDLRYSLPGDHQRIDLPEFPDIPAVQKVYLAAFLPQEMALLHYSGPWSDEFSWAADPGFHWKVKNSESIDSLTEWVTEGISSSTVPAFQTAGTAYLFSTLRPAPPPIGSLKLVCVHENTLAGGLIVSISVLGLLLLRSSVATKLAAIAIVLIACIACGVLVPILGRQLLNLPAVAGLTMVGLAWGAQAIARGLPSLKELLVIPRTRAGGARQSLENGPPKEATAAADREASSEPKSLGQVKGELHNNDKLHNNDQSDDGSGQGDQADA